MTAARVGTGIRVYPAQRQAVTGTVLVTPGQRPRPARAHLLDPLVLLLYPALVNRERDWITLLAGLPATVLIWLSATAITCRRQRLA
jgi:hypothetical protein